MAVITGRGNVVPVPTPSGPDGGGALHSLKVAQPINITLRGPFNGGQKIAVSDSGYAILRTGVVYDVDEWDFVGGSYGVLVAESYFKPLASFAVSAGTSYVYDVLTSSLTAKQGSQAFAVPFSAYSAKLGAYLGTSKSWGFAVGWIPDDEVYCANITVRPDRTTSASYYNVIVSYVAEGSRRYVTVYSSTQVVPLDITVLKDPAAGTTTVRVEDLRTGKVVERAFPGMGVTYVYIAVGSPGSTTYLSVAKTDYVVGNVVVNFERADQLVVIGASLGAGRGIHWFNVSSGVASFAGVGCWVKRLDLGSPAYVAVVEGDGAALTVAVPQVFEVRSEYAGQTPPPQGYHTRLLVREAVGKLVMHVRPDRLGASLVMQNGTVVKFYGSKLAVIRVQNTNAAFAEVYLGRYLELYGLPVGAEVLVGGGTKVYRAAGSGGVRVDLNYTILESIKIRVPVAVHVPEGGGLQYPEVFVRYGLASVEVHVANVGSAGTLYVTLPELTPAYEVYVNGVRRGGASIVASAGFVQLMVELSEAEVPANVVVVLYGSTP